MMKDEAPHEKPTPFLGERLLGMFSGEARIRAEAEAKARGEK
jgi:hypothetical protein